MMPAPDTTAAANDAGHGSAVLRVSALVRKEFYQIVRDPSSIAIAFLMPLLLLLLIGYGMSLDAENLPVALVVEQPGSEASSFIASFHESPYFRPVVMQDMREAMQAMDERRIDGIVRLRGDFARQLGQPGGASIQLIVNGSDANQSRLLMGYVQGAWASWLRGQAGERGLPAVVPIALEERIWFNSELRSRNFLVPGLIALIMTLIGSLLTALVMAREWERGTMEALLVTPVTVDEIILGKLIPNFLLGTGSLLLSVLLAVFLFEVPLRGSLTVLFGGSALFLLTSLGLGLLVSTLSRSQFVASQAALIVSFMPAYILSGLVFDINSTPWLIQTVSRVVPARYFVALLQTVFLAGNVWSVIWPNCIALAVAAVAFLGISRWRFHKRLD